MLIEEVLLKYLIIFICFNKIINLMVKNLKPYSYEVDNYSFLFFKDMIGKIVKY